MLETKNLMTAEELARLPSGEGKRYELVNGELRTMAAAGFNHGEISGCIFSVLYAYAQPRHLGRLCTNETGFVLRRQPDHVRAPDVAFVVHDRLPLHD